MSGTGSAPNPLISLGTLNRLRGSLVVPGNASLNITASYLGKAGITIALEGEATRFLEQMVGAVTSPEPYQKVSVRVSLIKTQVLASTWRTQLETMATIGQINVIPDTSAFPTYTFLNAAIQSVGEQAFNGEDAAYPITIGCYYNINQSLWSLT